MYKCFFKTSDAISLFLVCLFANLPACRSVSVSLSVLRFSLLSCCLCFALCLTLRQIHLSCVCINASSKRQLQYLSLQYACSPTSLLQYLSLQYACSPTSLLQYLSLQYACSPTSLPAGLCFTVCLPFFSSPLTYVHMKSSPIID